jgi:Flp pilus assembly protein TadB
MEKIAINSANINRYFLHVLFPDETARLLFWLIAASLATILGWTLGDLSLKFSDYWLIPVLAMLLGFCMAALIMSLTCLGLYFSRQKSVEKYMSYWVELVSLLLSSGVDLLLAIKYATNFLRPFDWELSSSIEQFFIDFYLFSDETGSWEHLLERLPNQRLANVISVFLISHRSGHGVLDTLNNFVDEMHNEVITDIQKRARELEGKLSVVLVGCFLPMFLTIFLFTPFLNVIDKVKSIAIFHSM